MGVRGTVGDRGLWSWRRCLDCARALGPSPGEGTQEPLPGRRPERDSVGSMTHSTVMCPGQDEHVCGALGRLPGLAASGAWNWRGRHSRRGHTSCEASQSGEKISLKAT